MNPILYKTKIDQLAASAMCDSQAKILVEAAEKKETKYSYSLVNEAFVNKRQFARVLNRSKDAVGIPEEVMKHVKSNRSEMMHSISNRTDIHVDVKPEEMKHIHDKIEAYKYLVNWLKNDVFNIYNRYKPYGIPKNHKLRIYYKRKVE